MLSLKRIFPGLHERHVNRGMAPPYATMSYEDFIAAYRAEQIEFYFCHTYKSAFRKADIAFYRRHQDKQKSGFRFHFNRMVKTFDGDRESTLQYLGKEIFNQPDDVENLKLLAMDDAHYTYFKVAVTLNEYGRANRFIELKNQTGPEARRYVIYDHEKLSAYTEKFENDLLKHALA
jgi:hypothetical protein